MYAVWYKIPTHPNNNICEKNPQNQPRPPNQNQSIKPHYPEPFSPFPLGPESEHRIFHIKTIKK